MKKVILLFTILALSNSVICQFHRGRGGQRRQFARTSRQTLRHQTPQRARTYIRSSSRLQTGVSPIQTPRTISATPVISPSPLSRAQQRVQQSLRTQTPRAPLVIRGGIGTSKPIVQPLQRASVGRLAQQQTYTGSLGRFRQPHRRDRLNRKWRRRPRWRPSSFVNYYAPYSTAVYSGFPLYTSPYYPSYQRYSPFTDATNIVNPEILGINPNEYPYYTDIPEKTIPYPSASVEEPLIIRGQVTPSYEVEEAPGFTTTRIDLQPQQQELGPVEQVEDPQFLLKALLEEELKNVHEE